MGWRCLPAWLRAMPLTRFEVRADPAALQPRPPIRLGRTFQGLALLVFLTASCLAYEHQEPEEPPGGRGAVGAAQEPMGEPAREPGSEALLEPVEEPVEEVARETAEAGAPEGDQAGWPPPPDLDAGGGWALDGFLDAVGRYRSQNRESSADTDLLVTGVAGATLADAAGKEVLRLQFDGVLTADLDGFAAPHEAFYGLQETFNGRVHGFVYEAWAETGVLLEGLDLRVGRQGITREDALFFDGLRADLEAGGPWDFTLYGGVPVHFYESRRSGDLLAGAGVTWSGRDLRLSLDEVYVRDARRSAGGPEATARDALTILSGRWLAHETLLVRGSASWIEDRDRRQEIALAWSEPESGWSARLRVRRQADYGQVVTTEFSPFSAVLGDVAPYWNTSAEVHRSFGSGVDAAVGLDLRRLQEDRDEGLYNREFERWFAYLTVAGFPVDTVEVGVRGDLWDARKGNDLLAGGAFVAADLAEGTRIEAGTDFALYRFDVFSGREELNDRRYYLEGRVPVADRISFRMKWEVDRSDLGTDHEIQAALGLDF